LRERREGDEGRPEQPNRPPAALRYVHGATSQLVSARLPRLVVERGAQRADAHGLALAGQLLDLLEDERLRDLGKALDDVEQLHPLARASGYRALPDIDERATTRSPHGGVMKHAIPPDRTNLTFVTAG
jgi:hypothetical protein